MDARPAFRTATSADAVALRDLERAASLRALAHIFPPESHPYPSDPVLERWRATLADPDVVVKVVDDDAGMACLIAYDAIVLRHLAVRPDRWGSGLARAAIELATADSTPRRLWCLRANHHALGLYRHLGWRPTGAERLTEWPPHPAEIELELVDP